MSFTRTLRRCAGPAAVLALTASLLAAPTAAFAAYVQYALNSFTPESTSRYSATATVRGGQAYAGSSIVRTYIQTLSGGVLIASAFADGGNTATMSHQPYSGAQSRCYWDLVGSSTSSTVKLNCWRLA